jgi:hypothetical protein
VDTGHKTLGMMRYLQQESGTVSHGESQVTRASSEQSEVDKAVRSGKRGEQGSRGSTTAASGKQIINDDVAMRGTTVGQR